MNNPINSDGIQTVQVELGKNSYPIHIGEDLLRHTGEFISQILPGSKCVIISDDNVAAAHMDTLTASLQSRKIDYTEIIVRPGEASKSFDVFQDVISKILDTRYERQDAVIGFGGGVVGDLAGFAAAVVRRGMNFIQIPTSLLAQVDSSVGGKTGINATQGKNLIGAFLQPKLVLADTNVLQTLSTRELRAGYAEVAKYGLVNDAGFFHWLEENHVDILNFGNCLSEAIAISCKAKAKVVAEDELEHGCRALLNLGHTFGHALEGATGYNSDRLVHGEGVAIGMVLAHEFSNRLNLCDIDVAKRVKQHLKMVGLPTSIDDIAGPKLSADELFAYITQDKKVSRGELTFILTKGLGKSYIAKNVPASEVLAFLKDKTRQ